jgi:hypothetical protein
LLVGHQDVVIKYRAELAAFTARKKQWEQQQRALVKEAQARARIANTERRFQSKLARAEQKRQLSIEAPAELATFLKRNSSSDKCV